MGFVLSVHFGHNASFTIARDGVILESLEVERLVGLKNSPIMYTLKSPVEICWWIKNYFYNKYGADFYDLILIVELNLGNAVEKFRELKKSKQKGPLWKAKKVTADTKLRNRDIVTSVLKIFKHREEVWMNHQDSHAASSLYQSNHKEAIIVSADGGGNDGWFAIYHAKRGEDLTKLGDIRKFNLGNKYNYLGNKIKSIRKEESGLQASLVYAGKLMGLAGYGDIRQQWVEPLKGYYGHETTRQFLYRAWQCNMARIITEGGKLGQTFKGKRAMDLAATNQFVFEEIFRENIEGTINEFKNLPLHITGGCAMNILNNSIWAKQRETHVIPNPGDCGLSLGLMLGYLKPENAFDSTYIGPEVFDEQVLPEYVHKYKAKLLDIDKLAEDLAQGKIVGVVIGRSEHGPRALGNRSILCNPMIEGMKDILNKKVKGREFFRPFAPILRYKDMKKYFNWKTESRWMTYAAEVKEEYKGVLTEVTHVDGTARLQTVRRSQNPWMYELLSRFEEKTGVGVLINTSFNIAGKPILNTYKDAVWVLENTDMDALVLENYYIIKEDASKRSKTRTSGFKKMVRKHEQAFRKKSQNRG